MTTNPILPGFHPDPSWCRVGDDYYMVTSTFTWLPGVPIFHSTDLENWTQIGNVLHRSSQVSFEHTDLWASFGIYAPTLRHHDGRFWMITTSTGLEGPQNFFVTAEDPAGPWSDPVLLDFRGIDPDLAWDDDGNCWVHHSVAGTGIMRCRIDDTTGEVLDEPVLTWSGTGMRFPEAPHLYRIGEWWYLMIAEGGTGSGHCVSIARGTSPTGPWEGCAANPVLSHRSMPHPIQNTGHADLVEDPSGRWWMALLGVRAVGAPAAFHVLGRESFLTTVEWEDGWPVVESPTLGDERPRDEFVDDFSSPELDVGWLARRRFPSEFVDLVSQPGALTLHGADTTLHSPRSSFVGRRQRHQFCQVDTAVEVASGEAGLAVTYDEHSHYRVGVDAEGVFATAVIGGVAQELAREPRPSGSVRLRLQTVEDMGGPDSVELGYLNDGGEFVRLAARNGRYLSSEVVGGFLGRIIGLYAAGGDASFHHFRYVGD